MDVTTILPVARSFLISSPNLPVKLMHYHLGY